MNRVKTAKAFASLYVIFIFLAISWGGYVRAMGAGLGCGPDWPLCNGYVVPPDLFTDTKVFLEYFHRIIAFVTGWIALGATIYILRVFKDKRNVIIPLLITDVLLLIQIFLGMLVVNQELNQFLSATHLAIATLTFGASVWMASTVIRIGDRL